jgi:hypothetical protein
VFYVSQKHVALAFTNKGRYITYAVNRTAVEPGVSMHAEEHLTRKLVRMNHHRNRRGGLVIYSLRLTKSGEFRMAKCCADCVFYLTRLHQKGYRVNKLGWSVNDDQLVVFPFREIHRLQYGRSSGRKAHQKKT